MIDIAMFVGLIVGAALAVIALYGALMKARDVWLYCKRLRLAYHYYRALRCSWRLAWWKSEEVTKGRWV